MWRSVWLGLTMIAMCMATEPAWALPLDQVIERTKASIAHISVVGEGGEEIGSGSGFIVSKDGKLVTNFHVIEGAQKAFAVFADESRFEVIGIVAFDPQLDIAVLKIASGARPSLKLSELPAKQGNPVTVIGSPQGLSGTVSTGIVSAVRESGVPAEGMDDAKPSWQLQITAAISSGSSGSPILNENAEVVGVAVGVHRGGQALNFGIPVAHARRVLERAGPPVPLSGVRQGRSVQTNLLISALGIGGAVLIGWLVSWALRRRPQKTPRRGTGSKHGKN